MADTALASAVLESGAAEWFMILSLVFGGCCSNVWALEAVIKDHPASGTFLTFAQFVFVTLQTISSQVYVPPGKGFRLPRWKRNEVPLRRWAVQVVLFLAVSLMNNYAFGLKIPVTVHIIFRSGGLCVSMLTGYFFAGKRYSAGQAIAGVIITAGIVLATLSAPRKPSSHKPAADFSASSSPDASTDYLPESVQYVAGIAMLSLALFLSAWLGMWQEQTYRLYGKKWREALFYCHFLSLPFFAPMYSSLTSTYDSYASSAPITLLSLPEPPLAFFADPASIGLPKRLQIRIPSALLALGVNVITQGLCIRGVNRLTSRVSSTTVNLILTLRKAASLAISVWFYRSGVSTGLAVGGVMVLGGTVIYSMAPAPAATNVAKKRDTPGDKVSDETPSEVLAGCNRNPSNSELRHRIGAHKQTAQL